MSIKQVAAVWHTFADGVGRNRRGEGNWLRDKWKLSVCPGEVERRRRRGDCVSIFKKHIFKESRHDLAPKT